MNRTHQVSGWFAPLLTCVAGCTTPIDAASAYTAERYLCGDEHAPEFDSQVEQCREANLRDGSCAGFVNLQGDIDEQHVVVDSNVVRATYAPDGDEENGVKQWQVVVNGRAPYFSFRVTLSGVPLDPGVREAPGGCGRTGGFLSLEARGASDTVPMYFSRCDVNLYTPDEMRIAFSSALGKRGSVDGCFHVFPQIL
jgi:hypothetical protein